MKCASATAGIVSVATGWAVVLSGAPAHATFLYLNQSQLITAAIGASGVASLSGESPTTGLDAGGNEGIASFAEKARESDAEHASAAIAHAGIQAASGDVHGGDVHGNDAGSVQRVAYSAPAGFRWMNLRSAFHANSALYLYRADANVAPQPASGSSAMTSPAKEAPAGSGSVTTPSAPAASAPSASVPNQAGSPPVHSTPISTLPSVETPIVGLPSKSVPEPSTVGLLGIGLLVFVGIARGKRAMA